MTKMYHVSTTPHGRRVKFEPKTYEHVESIEIPHVCVAPSVAGCLSAIKWFDVWDPDSIKDIYIYEALKPDEAIPCNNQVPDRHITDEHWFMSSAEFKLVGVIYTQSPLYKKLQIISCDAWAGYMDRVPCMDMEAQQKEFDLVTDLLLECEWGKDNMPEKQLADLSEDMLVPGST